jgi:hypothetical protein
MTEFLLGQWTMASNGGATIATATHCTGRSRSSSIDSIQSHGFKLSPRLNNTLFLGGGFRYIGDVGRIHLQFVNQVLREGKAAI